jgi:hypothetical protein
VERAAPRRSCELGAAGLERRVTEQPQRRKRVVPRHELHHPPRHLVAAEQVRHAVLRDELDGAACLEGVHDHRRCAGRERAEGEIEAEYAAKRDCGESAAVCRIEAEASRDGARMICDRALRVHDELRTFGGAGGGEQGGDRLRVGAIRHVGNSAVEGIERDGWLAEHAWRHCRGGPDDRNSLDGLGRRRIDLGQDRREIDFLERRLQHQHARAGSAQHMFELRCAEARIDRNQRRPDARDRTAASAIRPGSPARPRPDLRARCLGR